MRAQEIRRDVICHDGFITIVCEKLTSIASCAGLQEFLRGRRPNHLRTARTFSERPPGLLRLHRARW